MQGKPANVAEAKKKVMAQMTQQGSISVFIPKDHHRFVLGKGAERLKEIEKATGAKIRAVLLNSYIIRRTSHPCNEPSSY